MKGSNAINIGYPEDIETWRRCCLTQNSKNSVELLHGFFEFYSNFDYDKYKISPRYGIPIARLVKYVNIQCKDCRSYTSGKF